VKRLALLAAPVLTAAVLLGARLAACPLCAESEKTAGGGSVWPVIGVFILVPWVLGAVVTLVIRREMNK
jgi:hypothetical protein